MLAILKTIFLPLYFEITLESSTTNDIKSLELWEKRHQFSHIRVFSGSSSEPDFSGEINSFQLRLNFLAVILLHQDVLQTSNNFRIPDETSVEKMKSLSDNFFSQFITLSASSGRNDFKNGRQILQYSVDKNHFR